MTAFKEANKSLFSLYIPTTSPFVVTKADIFIIEITRNEIDPTTFYKIQTAQFVTIAGGFNVGIYWIGVARTYVMDAERNSTQVP